MKELIEQLSELNKKQAQYYFDEKNEAVIVVGDLDISSRLAHNNLKSIPLKILAVTGTFNCSDNYLTNLINCPSVIGADFICDHNPLTVLKEGQYPKIVGRHYSFLNNKFKSEGLSDHVAGSFEKGKKWENLLPGILQSKKLEKLVKTGLFEDQ